MIDFASASLLAILCASIAVMLAAAEIGHFFGSRAVGEANVSTLEAAILGLMALMTMVAEGSVLDWAALYLRQELGAELSVAGLAYAAFSGVMATVRFLGDGVRNRFGAVTTLRVSACIAAAGMLGAGLAPSAWLAIAAFALCGLGVANMVPIVFSAAGNQEGMSAGAGMSVVTTMGYSGILVAPSAIGFVAEHQGFRPTYAGLSLVLVLVAVLAARAADADGRAKVLTPAEGQPA